MSKALKFTAIFLAALGILGGITAEMIKTKPAFSPSESHPVIMVEEEIPPGRRRG